MEGGTTHAHTILSLSLPAYLNTVRACADSAYTYTHSPGTYPPTSPFFSTVDSKLDPQGPEAETEWQRKRSVDPLMCVLFTPPPTSSSSPLYLHPPFPPVPICTFSSLSPPLAVMQTFFPSLSATFSVQHTGCAFKHMAVTCKMTHTNSFWWARN